MPAMNMEENPAERRCSAADAITRIHRRLEEIVVLLDKDRAKLAFAGSHEGSGVPGSNSGVSNGSNGNISTGGFSATAEDYRQRLEWQLALAILPLLSFSALQPLHNSAMHVLGDIYMVLSRKDIEDDDTAFVSRAQELVVALISIAKDLTMPAEMPVLASRFKLGNTIHNGSTITTTTMTPSSSSGSNNRVWLSLAFESAREAVNMVSMLLSIFCIRTGWNRRGMDVFVESTILTLHVGPLVLHILTTLDDCLFGESWDGPQRGQLLQSLDNVARDDLYRICAGCVLSLVRLPSLRPQLLAEIGRYMTSIVWYHIMSLQSRYEAWCQWTQVVATTIKQEESPVSAMGNKESTIAPPPSLQAWRAQTPSIGRMELAIAEALYALMAELSRTGMGKALLDHNSVMVEPLLLSPELQTMSCDKSGLVMQKLLIDMYDALLDMGQATTAIETTKFITKHYAHLPHPSVVRLVLKCLCHPTAGRAELEPELFVEDGNADPHKRSRSPDRFENEIERAGSQSKRTKTDPSYSSYQSSMEDSGISSILPPTQTSERHASFTQRLNSTTMTGPSNMTTAPSPSMVGEVLLKWLRQLIARKGQTGRGGQSGSSSVGGSGGGTSSSSRGIELPPCSVRDLRSVILLLRAWSTLFKCRQGLNKVSTAPEQQVNALAQDIQGFCRTYLIWSLSPGMQDTAKNCTYLEESYPLMLDLVSLLAKLPPVLSVDQILVDRLITLASMPWFQQLARQEFWDNGSAKTGIGNSRNKNNGSTPMDIESANDEVITSQQQIVQSLRDVLSGSDAQLRNMCSLLRTCSVLASMEEQALRAMAKLPYTASLDAWRRFVMGGALERTTPSSSPSSSSPSKAKCDSVRVAALESLLEYCARAPNKAPLLQQLSRMLASLDSDEFDRSFVRVACHRLGFLLKELQKSSRSNDAKSSGIQYLPWSTLNYFGRLLPMSRELGLEEDLLFSFADALDCFDLRDEACRESQFLDFALDMLKSESPDVCRAASTVVQKIVRRALTTILDVHSHTVPETVLEKVSDAIQDAIYVAKDKRFAPFRTVILARVAEAKKISRERLVLSQITMISYFVIDHLLHKDVSQYTEDISWLRWMGHSTPSFVQAHIESILPLLFVMRGRDSLNRGVSFTQLKHEDQFKIVLELGKMLLIRPGANNHVDVPNDAIVVLKTCTDHVGPILAEVLMQADMNNVKLSLEILTRLCTGDNKDGESHMSVAELFAMSYQPLLFHVCLKLGSEEEDERQRAQKVIEIVQEDNDRQREASGAGASTTEGGENSESILHKYSLAIITHINKLVHDARQMNSMNKRLDAIRCLAELIRLLQPQKGFILGQVLTTLRALIFIKELQATVLVTLARIVRMAEPKLLAPLFLSTVHCLSKVYPTVEPNGRSIIAKILNHLIVVRNSDFKAHFLDLCALPQDPPFKRMNDLVTEVKRSTPFPDRLRRLSERIESEDPEMAEEALRELKEYLLQNKTELGKMTSKWPRVDDLLNTVVERLLRGIGRSKGADTPVSRYCLDCLGIIGAVDPARLTFVPTKVSTPVYKNFEDLEEAKDFVCNLLQNQLASPSRPVNDTLSEGYWGYAVQSLLAFCDITRDVITHSATSTRPASPSSWSSQASGTVNNTQASSLSLQPMRRFQPKSPAERWNAFSPDVREVLEPLVGAKYKEREAAQPPTQDYPFYTRAATFQDWMAMWAKHLISEVTNPYAREIFRACRRLLSYDLNTCQYLLPHLVLHVFLGKDDHKRRMIMVEMLRVLYDGRPQNPEDDPWELRVCEVSEKNQLGSQMVFSLLDHISLWVKWQKNQTSSKTTALRGRAVSASQQHRLEERELLEAVEMRLNSISRDIIAAASFRTRAYARSLLHHEQNIRSVRQRGGLGGTSSANIQQDSTQLQSMYHRLQEIYVNMDEPDGMEGITGLVTSDSLAQQIFAFESAGRWNEAKSCYTLGITRDPSSYDLHSGRYKCFRNLGDFEGLLTMVDGDMQMNPNMDKELNPYRIEAAWKTQNWELLATALEQPHWPTFDVMIGKILLDMRNNQVKDFEQHVREAKAMLIGPLAAASMESYGRGYEEMVKLSMLDELEQAHRAWNECIESGQPTNYLQWLHQHSSCLEQRLQATVPSFRVREQMMRLRRIAFYDLRIDQLSGEDEKAMLQQESAEIWLQTARWARRSKNSELTFSGILNAERLGSRSAIIERAKWEFLNDERRAIQAINSALTTTLSSSQNEKSTRDRQPALQGLRGSTLIQGRKILPPAIVSNMNRAIPSRIVSADSPLERKWDSLFEVVNKTIENVKDRQMAVDSIEFIRAKAKLLKARWMDRSQLADATDIADSYNQVIKECAEWDKGYYFLGHFYLRLYEHRRKKRGSDTALNSKLLTEGCQLYGKALSLGPKYLFQSLPKLLTLWLDVGSVYDKFERVRRHASETGDQSRYYEFIHRHSFNLGKYVPNTFKELCVLMENLNEVLPSYMFLSAFPQIISRMGHKNGEAAKILHKMIVNVLIAFPDQAIWQLVSVSRSVVAERRTTCNTLLQSVKSIPTLGIPLTDKIREAFQLCDTLITLCGAPVSEKATKLSLERDFPKQYKSLRPRYNIVVPGQDTLNPLIPSSRETMASHRPFREGMPQVECILDEIDVMTSLQRPRKITIRGSDGRLYVFLCKPKDDLRKDTKVVEVGALVNMLLRTDREASRRNLYIRQYAVVPLNEECGLIEWVKNTTPFRQIIHRQTKILGQPMPSVQEAKKLLDNAATAAHLFVHELLPKCPSVFYTWLQDISTSPTDWFATRLRYTRTTAVMSMVGYILGLGDRHGENILFDQKNGDIVHVDFNCIFEQAKSFPKPEKVPFRLTHNMVDAFGISGCDGVFRKTCEVTLSVFRSHCDAFTPILEGFLHDPLVEWSKKRAKHAPLPATPNAQGLDQNEYAGDAQQHDKAQSVLVVINKKLAGESMHGGQPLSVEGQVEELIRHATHPENLSAMYIGWSAYQ
ncbi:serine/threonine-protein kinase M1 [Actinomortierella wolfii]|nr:serine/threonine-protein kinase M1 [Actinomortierella wolfii]